MSENEVPEYLLKHFANIAKQEGFVTYTPLQEVHNGGGFIAAVQSFSLIGQRRINGQLEDHKVDLVCKVMPKSEIRNNQFNSHRFFMHEVFTYKHILSVLSEFQQNLGLTEVDGFFAYPTYYVATYNPDSDDTVVIMKDLCVDGYVMLDKSKPISEENVNLVMTQLGRLHGVSYALRDQKPELWESFQSINDANLRNVNALEEFCKNNFKKALTIFKDEPNLGKLQTIANEWLAWVRECCEHGVRDRLQLFVMVTVGIII